VDPEFAKELSERDASWRRVVAMAVSNGVPVPGMTASLGYFDTYRRERLPANMVQVRHGLLGERAADPARKICAVAVGEVALLFLSSRLPTCLSRVLTNTSAACCLSRDTAAWLGLLLSAVGAMLIITRWGSQATKPHHHMP
jgi:hypothetical protein